MCPDCNRGLCSVCSNRFTIPICASCNQRRFEAEGRQLGRELFGIIAVCCGISLFLYFRGIFFIPEQDDWSVTVVLFLVTSYVAGAFVYGWKALSNFTANTFLFLPIIGWLIYFILKVGLSFVVGLVWFPVKLFMLVYRFVGFYRRKRSCVNLPD